MSLIRSNRGPADTLPSNKRPQFLLQCCSLLTLWINCSENSLCHQIQLLVNASCLDRSLCILSLHEVPTLTDVMNMYAFNSSSKYCNFSYSSRGVPWTRTTGARAPLESIQTCSELLGIVSVLTYMYTLWIFISAPSDI